MIVGRLAWLNNWFSAVVSALAYAFLEKTSLPSKHAEPNRVTAFILFQHGQMPDYLRWPLLTLTFVFDLSGLLRFSRRFHRQTPERRRQHMEAWRRSAFGPCRDLMRFYDSLIVLGWTDGDLPRLSPDIQKRDEKPEAPSVLTNRFTAQIAVVGSGPGGTITAGLLAEAGLDVMVIEEGKNLDLESCRPFSAEEMLQKYRSGGLTLAMGKPKVSYVEGRCVGGGSEINSGLYHRTPLEILERWQSEFGLEVKMDDLRPHFEACERDLAVGLTPGKLPLASLKLEEGARKMGWQAQEVPRWFAYDGGTDEAGIPTGQRQSMTRTFLKRFLKAGGRIDAGLWSKRLVRTANGFEISARTAAGRIRDLRFEKVFLSCGAIGTPALLLRSGIKGKFGPGLQMHPTVKVIALFNEEVNSERMGVPVHQVKEFASEYSFGCSISSVPYLSLAMIDHPSDSDLIASSWKRMAIYYAMIVPEGRGNVRVLPGFKDPLTTFALTSHDLQKLAEALKKLSALLFAAGAVRLLPSVGGIAPLESPGDISRIPNILPANRTNLMSVHLFSSCPMGENLARCSVDSFGRVRDIPGLHIADASLLPTAPGVNPQGSIMAFARRNALRFADVKA